MFPYLLFLLFTRTFAYEIPQNRTKRFIIHPPNSATGVLVALAIPLDLPHRAVFVSYNFESNYSPPVLASDYTQALLQKFPSTQAPNGASPDFMGRASRSAENSLITRKSVYKILEDHIGRPCLLRTICNVASEPFAKYNGFLGDVLHVIFLPSTSRVEGLPNEFWDAEDCGIRRNCDKYDAECPLNLLDLISLLK